MKLGTVKLRALKPRKRFLLLFLVCISAFSFAGCNLQPRDAEFSQVNAICELATLRCYYHNVANYEEGQDSLFRFGYKKMWIEYSGIVTIGMDASKVAASKPDQDGLIRVTLPKVKVLDIDFDENSIAEVTETGMLASVSAKEKTETLAFAQADMEETVRLNETLLSQGQERARKVIKEYILKVGAALGKAYTVEWVDVD